MPILIFITLNRSGDPADYHIQKDGTVAAGLAYEHKETAISFTSPDEATLYLGGRYSDYRPTFNYESVEVAG